jgi:Skp family chaperone for outer membrane proteins
MSKKLLFACVALCGASQVAAQEVSVNRAKGDREELFVNMQEVMLQSKQGLEAQRKVEAEEKKYTELAQKDQQNIVEAQKDFIKIKSEMEQKAPMLTPEAQRIEEKKLRSQEAKVDGLRRAYDANMNEWRMDIQSVMQRETDLIINDIKDGARVLAEKTGKKKVTDIATGQTLYLHDDWNSTNDLLATVNANYDAKKKPAQAPLNK